MFLTLFDFNASLRCSAPLAPIWFHLRSREVSVCIEEETSVWEKPKEYLSYLIRFQSITQMFCSFISDFIPGEIEWIECLYRRRNISMRKTKRMSFLPHSISMHHSNVLLLSLRFCSLRDWVKWVSVSKTKYQCQKKEKNTLCLFSIVMDANHAMSVSQRSRLFCKVGGDNNLAESASYDFSTENARGGEGEGYV